MAAGIDGHATVREVRLGSIGTRRKKAPKGVPSDAAARLTATGEADEVAEARRAQGRLLSTLLAGIAQFERELIRERTGEDRKRAMAEGVKFNRKQGRQAPCSRRDLGVDRQELRRRHPA